MTASMNTDNPHSGRPVATKTLQIAPIGRRRVVETVVERLEEPILNGTLRQGDMLPSEGQLAAQLGVGRRGVREALKVLETKGLIEVQVGVGAIVRRNDLDNFLDALVRNVVPHFASHQSKAGHVMELRFLLEGAALRKLAATPNPQRTQRIAHAVAMQRQAHAAQDFHAYQEWHFRFHHEIVDALENPLIGMIYDQVMALMRKPMEASGSDPVISARAIRDHQRMVDAMQQGDTDGLQAILDDHLQRFISAMEMVENRQDGTDA